MKNTRLTSILSSGLIAGALLIGSLASTQSASAQSTMVVAKVNIPFAFQLGNRVLPSGTYIIDRKADHLILLHATKGSEVAYVVTHDETRLEPADHGSIVFDRYGDKYFLRQIWRAREKQGFECPKSRAEKEATMARNDQPATTIELAFNSDEPK